jgi:hypothetical protein
MCRAVPAEPEEAAQEAAALQAMPGATPAQVEPAEQALARQAVLPVVAVAAKAAAVLPVVVVAKAVAVVAAAKKSHRRAEFMKLDASA